MSQDGEISDKSVFSEFSDLSDESDSSVKSELSESNEKNLELSFDIIYQHLSV